MRGNLLKTQMTCGTKKHGLFDKLRGIIQKRHNFAG